MKKYLLVFTLVLPSIAFSADLDGFYITPKVGISKTFDTGQTNAINFQGVLHNYSDEDLGEDIAFGFSVGKSLNDNFRLELEAIKRTDYEFDVLGETGFKAEIETHALFVNGFYDFQPFSLKSTSITPYLGGGMGISRNKMGTNVQYRDGSPDGSSNEGETINRFTYKLSAGILFSLTENLSLDVNYQYVDLGSFKSGTEVTVDGVRSPNLDDQRGINGGDIKAHELMVGLQYKF